MQKFLNIKVHQLIFTNPLIRITRLKLVKKKKINKDILRLESSQMKKWNNYDLLLAINKEESFIKNKNKKPKKIRILSLIKILRVVIKSVMYRAFLQNLCILMQVWVSDSLPLECNATRKVSFPLQYLPLLHTIVCHFLVSNMLGVRVGVGTKNRKV